MRNIFLKKSYSYCGHETSPRSIQPKLSHSLDQQSEILRDLCLFISSRGLPKYIETKVLTTCFYSILNLFIKSFYWGCSKIDMDIIHKILIHESIIYFLFIFS